MIRIHLPHNYLGLVAGCLCLGSLAASCVSDDLGCIEDRPGYVEGNDIWLTFTLKGVPGVGRSASGISRADDTANHPEEEATAAENKINTDDMRLILFDNRRNVIKVLERKDLISFITTDGENNSRYEIKARINKAYFDFATTSTGDIEISLMLLANLSSGVTSSSNDLTDALFMKSAQWIAQQKYAFQPVWSADKEWYPDGSTTCIPMSGWAHYTIKSAALNEATTIENALQLTTDASPLLMPRAMAKIRVFDNINKENPDAATEITAVRIEGGNAYGAFIPDFSQSGCTEWANGTTMVETPTIGTNWFDSTLTIKAREVGSDEGGDYTDAYDNTFTEAFIAYMTEASRNQNVKLIITTYSDNDNPKTKEWELFLSNIMIPVTDITRNHIYEFTVTRSMSAELNINYTVCPWVSNTINVPPFD